MNAPDPASGLLLGRLPAPGPACGLVRLGRMHTPAPAYGLLRVSSCSTQIRPCVLLCLGWNSSRRSSRPSRVRRWRAWGEPICLLAEMRMRAGSYLRLCPVVSDDPSAATVTTSPSWPRGEPYARPAAATGREKALQQGERRRRTKHGRRRRGQGWLPPPGERKRRSWGRGGGGADGDGEAWCRVIFFWAEGARGNR
jgi:hypothetical protein